MSQVRRNFGSGARLLTVLAVGLALWGRASPAAGVDLATGLGGAIGVASDPVNGHVYFVEYVPGTLKRLNLVPGCDLVSPPTCTLDTVATGFSHPEDVALDVDRGLAYVTTRDDPGTSGALWRVDLAGGAKSLVTFNLGAPQQIVLDTPTHSAYVAAYDAGKLWRVDLTTGAKVALMTGLGHPVGLAVTADRSRAYVTEQDPPRRLSEIDLALGARVADVVTGLTAPFFLAWTDPAQYALYLVERDPANRIQRVDLPTASATPIVSGLPFRPSAAAVDLLAGALYVTTNDKLVKVALATLPMSEPVFLGVGHVPSTSIADGYATTDPGYFYQVKDSPFGGTLNILGNLSNFKALGATHYRVKVAHGGVTTVLTRSWNAYRWNPATTRFELTPVAPVAGDDRYEIPPEYPTHAERWYPAYLMMRWASGDNGLYTFSVELFKQTGGTWTDLTGSIPAGNSLTVRIDNSAPTVDVLALRQHGTSAVIPACAIISPATHGANHTFDVQVTAHDPSHHLLSYSVRALWGHNGSAGVFSDSYSAHVDAEGPRWWSGVTGSWVPPAGWTAVCNCAHTFYLSVWKRTIDGYNYILRRDAHQSLTINNTGAACAP